MCAYIHMQPLLAATPSSLLPHKLVTHHPTPHPLSSMELLPCPPPPAPTPHIIISPARTHTVHRNLTCQRFHTPGWRSSRTGPSWQLCRRGGGKVRQEKLPHRACRQLRRRGGGARRPGGAGPGGGDVSRAPHLGSHDLDLGSYDPHMRWNPGFGATHEVESRVWGHT